MACVSAQMGMDGKARKTCSSWLWLSNTDFTAIFSLLRKSHRAMRTKTSGAAVWNRGTNALRGQPTSLRKRMMPMYSEVLSLGLLIKAWMTPSNGNANNRSNQNLILDEIVAE